MTDFEMYTSMLDHANIQYIEINCEVQTHVDIVVGYEKTISFMFNIDGSLKSIDLEEETF